MRLLLPGSLLALAVWCGPARAADPQVIDLWPGKVPGEGDAGSKEEVTGEKGNRRVANVGRPTITVFRPAKEKDTGTAVVVAPGGGYNFLSWDHEGEDVARWLTTVGVTGVVLKYRVPRRPEHPSRPLMDAQRAVSLVRSKAAEWDVDAGRIGMLGFSAGGHLTAVAETNADRRAYEPVDGADKAGCRPDFAVLVYPGGLTARGGTDLVPDVRVAKDTPPTFLVHCSDDRGSSEQSVLMYLALKRAGVPAEMHVYATGGHGFGIRPGASPAAQWPKRCEEWMRARHLLDPQKK